MRRNRAERRLAEALLTDPDDRHYGYELSRRAHVRPGVLYPALTRFVDAGWLMDGWEDPPPRGRPPRRYYRLTPEGRSAFARMSQDSAETPR